MIRLAAAVLSAGLLLATPASSGEPGDSTLALREAAQRGDVAKQYDLAQRYRYGEGVPKDDAEALRWLRRAAEGGHADAQHDLGFRFEWGTGVPRDHAEALRWYRRAAEKGHSSAQNNLGELYMEGKGVARDCAEAAKWFQLAAPEDPRAQLHLGQLHLAGCGVAADDAEALRWFLRAADGWNTDAQGNLAAMYRSGRGVRKDEQEAAKWSRRARATHSADASGFTLEDWVYLLGLRYPRHLREEAEQRVRDAGSEAVPLVVAELRRAAYGQRIIALSEALERLGPEAGEAVPALEAILASKLPDDKYRPFVVAALARVDPARGQPFAAELERCALDDAWHTWVRLNCLQALNHLASPSVAAGIRLLKDDASELRAEAAEGLAKGEARDVRGPLETSLRDSVLEVRVRAAASLLRVVPDPPAAALPALLEGVCQGDVWDSATVVYTLEAIPRQAAQPAVEPLVAKIRGTDPKCRTWAAVALGRVDSPRAVPALGLLRAALAAEEGALRRAAAWTLASMAAAAREALPDLERAAAADTDLVPPLRRLRSGPTALDEHRLEDVRLAALGARDGVNLAYLVNAGGRVWEVQPGQRLLDGEIVRVGSEAVDFRGSKVANDFGVRPFAERLEIFPGGDPAPITWDRTFTGRPLSVNLDIDVRTLAVLLGHFAGLNVVVEGGTAGPVRLAARKAPWDGVMARALEGNGFGYRLDGNRLRIARRDRVPTLPRLASRRWTGRPISLAFVDGDVSDIARLYADISGYEVDLPAGSFDPVTIVVHDLPWDETLEMILATRGLAYRIEGQRLRIEAAR